MAKWRPQQMNTFREMAREDELDMSPILEYDIEKYDEPGDLWKAFENDVDAYKDDWIRQNRETIEDVGADPEDAFEEWKREYIERSRHRLAGRVKSRIAPRFPEPPATLNANAWLDRRAKRARTQWWGDHGEEAFELEVTIRDLLMTHPEIPAYLPDVPRLLAEEPWLVRSMKDPEMRFVRWQNHFAMADYANEMVAIHVDALDIVRQTGQLIGHAFASDGEGYHAMQEIVRELESRYPGLFTWEYVPLGYVVISWMQPVKHPEENPARAKLRSAVTTKKRNPSLRCRTCGMEYRHGSKHNCPEIALLFDASVRGPSIPQDFANEIRRDRVLGVDDNDWRILERGGRDHDDDEDDDDLGMDVFYETWEEVLDRALLVEEPITKGHLVDVLADAEEVAKQLPQGTTESLRAWKNVQRLRAELREEGERVMQRARHLSDRERDNLLIEHGAIVYRLERSDDGDILQVPWGMEWDDEENWYVWPRCVDCAIGSPDPHECGAGDFQRCEICDRDVRDCGGCKPPEKNPRSTLRRPWRSNTTIVLEWAPVTMGWTPWLESASGQRIPISIPVGISDADEAFRLAEAFLRRTQTSEFTRKDDDPVLNPRPARKNPRRTDEEAMAEIARLTKSPRGGHIYEPDDESKVADRMVARDIAEEHGFNPILLKMAIEDWLVENDLDYDTRVYTRAEWVARDEEYGNDAPISISSEGTLNYLLNGYLPSPASKKAEAAFEDFLGSLGLYWEMGHSWSIHLYPSGDAKRWSIADAVQGANERRPLRQNPAPVSAQLEDAKAKFEEFHRKKPTKVGEFHKSFSIPSKVGELGKAVHVLYRSDKKDPATGKQPKKPIDYIHEHYAGVHCYAPDHDELEQVDVPDFVRKADALVLLGQCLGFRFKDDDGEHDAEAEDPLPELYATPCGKALIVVQDKRSVLAMIWGGGLGVWARGIDG